MKIGGEQALTFLKKLFSGACDSVLKLIMLAIQSIKTGRIATRLILSSICCLTLEHLFNIIIVHSF